MDAEQDLDAEVWGLIAKAKAGGWTKGDVEIAYTKLMKDRGQLPKDAPTAQIFPAGADRSEKYER